MCCALEIVPEKIIRIMAIAGGGALPRRRGFQGISRFLNVPGVGIFPFRRSSDVAVHFKVRATIRGCLIFFK